MFSWIVWAPEVVIFSDRITSMLANMTAWEVAHPTAERKGLLPTATTCGDYLFISSLTATYINLAWVGLTSEETSAWGGFIASMVVLTIMMWRG